MFSRLVVLSISESRNVGSAYNSISGRGSLDALWTGTSHLSSRLTRRFALALASDHETSLPSKIPVDLAHSVQSSSFVSVSMPCALQAVCFSAYHLDRRDRREEAEALIVVGKGGTN